MCRSFYLSLKRENVSCFLLKQPFLLFLLVDDDEHDWILKTCRKGWDENVGYRPDLVK